MLSQADYSDVVDERNILNLCGYPLCSKLLKKTKQLYHISIRSKKVYDITERKCFCSNECYKASKFLKLQLSEIPIWFVEDIPNVKLLNDNSNRGSPGEEVVFKESLQEQIHEDNTTTTNDYSFEQLLSDDISECAAQFKDLVVKEREINTDEEVAEDDDGRLNNPTLSAKKTLQIVTENNNDSELDSDDDREIRDNKFFPVMENKALNLHKTMPAVKKPLHQPPILIDPLPLKKTMTAPGRKSDMSFSQMKHILGQWITVKSYKIILGDVNEDPAIKFEESFEKLCRSVDVLEASDEALDEKFRRELGETPSSSLPDHSKSDCGKPIVHKESNTVKKNAKAKKKSKSVSFSESRNETSKNDVSAEPVIPLVDSVSQDALRLQIVTERLKVAYCHLLPLVGLHFRDVSKYLRDLLLTFKFSANNITNTPFEWKMIALILLRMLKRQFIHCDDVLFVRLLSISTLDDVGSLRDIDELIRTLGIQL